MYARREIKKQRFRCWSDHFITSLNKGDGGGEDGWGKVVGWCGLAVARDENALLIRK